MNIKLLIPIFLLTTNLKAKENSDFNKFYDLSEDVRVIVIASPDTNPMPDKKFQLNTEQADQMKVLTNLDQMTKTYIKSEIDKDCNQDNTAEKKALKQKIQARDMDIYLTVLTTDQKFEQNYIGRFMANDYNNYIGKIAQAGNQKANAIYSLSALENLYQQTTKKKLSELSFAEKEKELNDFASNYIGMKLPDGLLMKEMAFNQMVDHSATWKETLNVAKEKLTTQQKIELVSKLGGFFGNRYNYTRFNDEANASEGVAIEKLLDSVKSGKEGGVCRDIALAQTQVLRELGFKNNYVLSYKDLNGYHADVISTDPETGKVVKFNYAETTEMKKGSGTESLNQNSTMPDHGINYRISDADGKPVTQVSSELGNILKESSGGTIATFTNTNYSLYRVGINAGVVDGNLFTGKTSSGENIYGVALFKKIDSKYSTIEGGLSASKVQGDRLYMNIDQTNLYGRINEELRTGSIDIGPTSTKGFAAFGGEIIAYKAVDTNLITKAKNKTDGFQIDGKIEGQVGIKNEIDLGDTKFYNKTYVNLYPDFKNVADAKERKIVTDGVMIENALVHNLSEEQAIIVESAVMLKNYGTSIATKAMYEDSENNFRIKTSYETPVGKDVPSFLPGGSKKASFGVEKETKDNLFFTLELEKNLSNNSKNIFLRAEKKF